MISRDPGYNQPSHVPLPGLVRLLRALPPRLRLPLLGREKDSHLLSGNKNPSLFLPLTQVTLHIILSSSQCTCSYDTETGIHCMSFPRQSDQKLTALWWLTGKLHFF